MKPTNIFSLAFLAVTTSFFAQEPAWWTQQKKDCNLDSKLAYNKWVEQGSPCNTIKPAVVVVPTNDPNAVLIAKEAADRKAKYEADKKAAEEAEAKKKKEEEERREKEKQEALKRMGGTSTQNFGLNAAPDFDGLNGGQTNTFGLNSTQDTKLKTSNSTTATTNNLQSGDPMVVDARNLPSGLSKDIEKSINDIYKDSPEVCAKVKKAFQSVQIKDWKVAKVWFQEALKLDPNNKSLKNFVAICEEPPIAPKSQKTVQEQQKEWDDYWDKYYDELEKDFEIEKYRRDHNLSPAPKKSTK